MTDGAPLVAGLGGVLLFLVAGGGLVELLPALRERPWPARLGFSYLLGVAAVAGPLYLLGIALDVRIRRGVVLAPAILLVALGLLVRLFRRSTPGLTPYAQHPPMTGVVVARFAFVVSAFISAGLFAEALTQPNLGWDGEMTWSAAARWIRADRSVTPRALVDPRAYVSHPRYPILLPLAQVAVQEVFDAHDDRRVAKPLYAAFFPALLLVVFDLSRRHAGTCGAALATLALACIPVLAFTGFGGADGTYSDIPLGAFLGTGLLLLIGPLRISEAVAASILLGATVLTKNEGLPFAGAALAAASFGALVERPNRRGRRLARLAPTVISVIGTAFALREWQRSIPQRWDEDYSGRFATVSLAKEFRERAPLIPRAVAMEVTDPDAIAGFGFAAPVILISGFRGLRRRIVPPILLTLYYCLGAYVLALLLSTWGGVEQLHPTFLRLFMQLIVPSGVLLALVLRTAWRARWLISGSAVRRGVMSPTTRARVIRPLRERAAPLTIFLVFVTLPVFGIVVFTVSFSRGASSLAKQVTRRVVAPPSNPLASKEDASLTGSIDEPAEGSSVRGSLRVRGWARIPGRDLDVTVLIDGTKRSFLDRRRLSRSDVASAVPGLGDCSSAGYEVTFPFSASDVGPHTLEAVFQTTEQRVRHYPVRHFFWLK